MLDIGSSTSDDAAGWGDWDGNVKNVAGSNGSFDGVGFGGNVVTGRLTVAGGDGAVGFDSGALSIAAVDTSKSLTKSPIATNDVASKCEAC